MKSKPNEALSLEEQLEIATSLDVLRAEFVLRQRAVRELDVKKHLIFSPQQLRDYIRAHPKVPEALLQRSYDQRVDKSAFMMETDEGFAVGWFSGDSGFSDVKQCHSIEDAALDFVFAWWKLPRP